jgi:hypothetical protein
MVPWLCFSGPVGKQNIVTAGVCIGGECSPHGRQEAECMEESRTRYNLQRHTHQ